jgi:hypothetical protein
MSGITSCSSLDARQAVDPRLAPDDGKYVPLYLGTETANLSEAILPFHSASRTPVLSYSAVVVGTLAGSTIVLW